MTIRIEARRNYVLVAVTTRARVDARSATQDMLEIAITRKTEDCLKKGAIYKTQPTQSTTTR